MKNKVEEFIEDMSYKADLINMSPSEIASHIKSREDYENYLKECLKIIKNDHSFLIFDESIINKMLTVFIYFRFDKYKDKDNKKYTANEVIDEANLLVAKSEAEKFDEIVEFIAENSVSRNLMYEDFNSILSNLAKDIEVYKALKEKNYNNIDSNDFITSIGYFLEKEPNMFNDVEFLKEVRNQLDYLKRHLPIKDRENIKTVKAINKRINKIYEENM